VDDCGLDVTLPDTDVMVSLLELAGVNGSFVMSGNDEVSDSWLGVLNSTDLMKTTWQFSACNVQGLVPTSPLRDEDSSESKTHLHTVERFTIPLLPPLLAFLALLNFIRTIYLLTFADLIILNTSLISVSPQRSPRV
jgi:hypothetical protein